jgi:hypothetical protein
MKKLKYQLCTEINRGTEDEPQIEQVLSAVTLGWSAANEEVAKREAYNGEYEIIDDGELEPVATPSNEELAEKNQLLNLQDTVDTLVLDALGV